MPKENLNFDQDCFNDKEEEFYDNDDPDCYCE